MSATFIAEPLGCEHGLRYIVVSVHGRWLRIWRTARLWSAIEVRDAWQRGEFAFCPVRPTKLPKEPACPA